MSSPIPARIAQLRQAMTAQRLAAYLVPSADPHLSEYLPGRWQGRRWLSGFNGSVGTLVVTQDFAGLWADSRYWVQAEAELAGTGIELMKIPAVGGSQHIDWLAANVPAGKTVGVDGAVLGLAMGRTLDAALQANNIAIRTDIDLLDSVWPDRPSLPISAIYEHLPPYATQSRAERLALVRKEMMAKGAQYHFVSTVDDLAWLFNLRGDDVSYNPVFIAHALIGMGSATLFLAEGKVPADVAAALAKDRVTIAAYAEASPALAALPAHSTLLLDPRRITLGLRQAVAPGVKVVEAINPSTFAKSRKSSAEAQYVRAAMEQDGAALCEFFSWLEGALGKERVTEVTIDEQICAARARRPGFVSPSFATIAGFKGNGAMPHYRATEESHAVIEGNGLLLIDSGGQYLGGTTDITRVVPVGSITAAEKRDFTLVLKGMIALSMVQFPRGTASPRLDAIARAPIWAGGVDYGHGTGHGVGYFLNVHEGPQSISPGTMPEPHTAMELGMITSNEPGIYRPGRWGVRIENLVLNVPAETNEFGEFIKFETLTLCPIDTRCIDKTLLRADEVAWLNDYHAMVKTRLESLVEGPAKNWLYARTAAI
ncbi:aminopeptidase P family protein [Chitinimonas sp. BJB300]|uniref:aminopeptidase P family protein n=1 Tax=Chitinimonas sp. BJB300 TaxID=1559339 RepID=UPI000C0D54A4|nr:aminopeptidase P family protein [Chitinimonas sp. BJB300]PHV12538.1 Xaa-Pro aminopeptidase [Chitinimonas sp. BJB300]TSJ91657.1 aminopeptidase P family protein [Chitinimonas sp. BJB300]